MKHILITGKTSYIGNAVAEYLENWQPSAAHKQLLQNQKIQEPYYCIEKVSLKDATWEQMDFSGFQSILHVAGLAHADVESLTKEQQDQYYKINRDLAVQCAKKAKDQGVKQFIYLSSVIVYGDSAKVGQKKHITRDTIPTPANFYGDSKLQAENALKELADESFSVAILRCPMVYGKGSKGNYKVLETMAKKLPVFPKVNNERSMIYIENLAEFIRKLSDTEMGGIFVPQNDKYVRTCDMVKTINQVMGKKMLVLSIGAFFVWLASKVPGKIGKLVNKAFGSLTVDKDFNLGEIGGYQLYSLEESIRRMHEG